MNAAQVSTQSEPDFRHRLVASLTRCYPFYSGRGRIANHPWLEAVVGTSADRVWTQVTGGEILAPLGDHVGRAAFFCGDLDPKVTAVFRSLIEPGDTVLDIGANIGVTTLAMASMVGAEGKVHSFEPNPELQSLLRQVIERNGLKNVTLHAMALGPANDDMELRVPATNFGMGSLVRHGAPDDTVHTVPVRRLSDIVAAEGIRSIRLIKIDVEGFEADVFAGAEEVLRDVPPDAILFELNEAGGLFGDQPVVSLLDRAGYEFLSIPQSMVRMQLRPIQVQHPVPGGGNDYLAVRRGVVLERIRPLVLAS